MNSVFLTGLRKIEKGVYICKELSWGFMFEEKELLAVRSDYVNAEGQWNETFIKAHAEARPDCRPTSVSAPLHSYVYHITYISLRNICCRLADSNRPLTLGCSKLL